MGERQGAGQEDRTGWRETAAAAASRLVRAANLVTDQLSTQNRALIVLGLAVLLALFLWALPPGARLALATGLRANRLLIVLLLVFSLLTLSLLWSHGQRLDTLVFLYFNRHRVRTPLLDALMLISTQIGNGVTGLSGAILFFLLGYRRLGIEMALGILTLWLAVELMKALTGRTRPYLQIIETQIVGWHEHGRSFPSGHTAQTFFLMTLLAHHFALGVWGSLALFLLAVVVGFTRVYIGVHFPRDVAGGAVLGAVWGIFSILVDEYFTAQLIR